MIAFHHGNDTVSYTHLDVYKRQEQAYSEERAHWQSLFTEKDKGMENGKLCWTAPSLSEEDWQTISLPGYWEGKGLKDFDGIIWFRRSLEIPAEWAGKPLTLRLGMIRCV